MVKYGEHRHKTLYIASTVALQIGKNSRKANDLDSCQIADISGHYWWISPSVVGNFSSTQLNRAGGIRR